MSDKEIWVLTEEYDEHAQHGEYYVRAFIGKPSIDELVQAGVGVDERMAKVLVTGGSIGGGIFPETYCWYNLIKQEN